MPSNLTKSINFLKEPKKANMEVGTLEPTPLAFLWLLLNSRKLYLPLGPLGPPLSFCLLPTALAAPET